MGIALWLSCAAIALGVARIVPGLRRPQLLSDIAATVGAAAASGLTATALDFGGWNELDWRAGLFAFLVTCAVLGCLRIFAAARAVRPHADA